MNFPTLRASVAGGSLFRIGFGAFPFLLPLMMQEGFGYTPLQSGLMTFASASGAFGMRTVSRFILRRFGFRTVLVWNGLVSSFLIAVCALFTPATPVVLMVLVIFLGGLFRSLEFTSINSIAFSDLEPRQMSQATSFTQMAQRLSMSLGVAVSAFVLHAFSPGNGVLRLASFHAAWLVVAALSAVSVLVFMRLDPEAGSSFPANSPKPLARSRRPRRFPSRLAELPAAADFASARTR